MIEYITIADVDELLGPAWAVDAAKPRAVLIANVWLTSKNLPELDPIPQEWVQAGAEIARESVSGNVYGQSEYGLLSKSVEADTVSSSKTFATGHKVTSAGENLALALIKPWIGAFASVYMLKRI